MMMPFMIMVMMMRAAVRRAGADEAVAVAVRFAFRLDGAVLDAVVFEFVRDFLHDGFRFAHAEVARDDDMAGERVQAAGNRPQVQVMHGDDAIGGAQGGEQPRLINMRRAAFHQDVQCAFQHADAALADERGDKQADQRVGPAPAKGEALATRRRYGADRAEQVAEDVAGRRFFNV